MHKALLALAAMATATASQAAVQINFNSVAGNLGSNTHVYSNGAYSVTATGYSNFVFGTNSGNANNLYGKADGGDENGVGLLGDPAGQHEIWYANNNFQTIPAIVLNVSSLLGVASSAQFLMGSTTSNEQWRLWGYNGSAWSFLTAGTSEGVLTNLPSWGTYSQYAFISGGTFNGESRTTGNVLLSALSLTPAVPEPGTWMLMLIGFGGIGLVVRNRATSDRLAQVA